MSLSDNPWFQIVKTHIDSMLEFGRGPDSPLFGGVVDAGLRQVLTCLSIPPSGVRISDYNWGGNNLMHDIPLLEVMIALTQLTGDGKYEQAVDEMFSFYAANCPHKETGLFPWGEHAQWSFADRDILPCSFLDGLKQWRETGSIIHDHLRFAPGWFWERMWKAGPDAVVKFAKGLNGHIVDVKTFEHNRHAALAGPWWRDPHKPDFDQGKDFARHAGFFIFDCLFAFKRSGDRSLYEWSQRKLEWHMQNRLPNGIIRGPIRSKAYEMEGQHDSFALSLMDSVDVLGRDTAEGQYFLSRAEDLFESRRRQRTGQNPVLPECPKDPRLWLCGYSRKHLLPEKELEPANVLKWVYDRTGIQWYADQLVENAGWMARNLSEPPKNVPLMPRGAQHHIELMLLGHDVSSDASLLQAAERVAQQAIERFWTGTLVRGMSDVTFYGRGTNYEFFCDPWATDAPTPGLYHSVSGAPLFVRTLLQLALKQEKQKDILGPDPHRR